MRSFSIGCPPAIAITIGHGHVKANALPRRGDSGADSALIYVKSGSPVHDWPGHPETYERMGSIERALEKSGLARHGQVRELTGVAPATLEDVSVIHDPRYLAALEEKTKSAIDVSGLMVDESTYITRSSYMDAMQGAGAVKAAVDAMMESHGEKEGLQKAIEPSYPAGFALSRPPGHHCTRNRPMGFCILNNAAIAAKYVQSAYSLKKIAIIDFDVHHGNGTQDLFYSDPSVLFMSIHQEGSFPGTGKVQEVGLGDGVGTTLNIPLPGDSGHMGALQAFEGIIVPKLKAFEPEFIIVSAGYDAHLLDPLGGLQYNGTTYFHLTRNIMDAAKDLCAGKCLFILEGGYHLEALGESVASTFSAILGSDPIDSVHRDWLREEPRDGISKILSEVKSIHEL